MRARFGAHRTVNDWGGNSAVTTRALEELHYQGLLRVVRHENGTKIYEAVRARSQNVPAHERLERLTMLIARTLAPTPESSLRSAIGQLCHTSGGFVEPQTAVADLMERGELRATLVDGVRYVWPRSIRVPADSIEARQVRFLAPFDPVVWDRRRFAHLWGWQYRLEAYVPANKRQFGYYALPVLWGNDAIGWVNCERTPKGALSVEVGYTNGPIKTRAFPSAFDTEIARLELMLGGRNEAPRRRSHPTNQRAQNVSIGAHSSSKDGAANAADHPNTAAIEGARRTADR